MSSRRDRRPPNAGDGEPAADHDGTTVPVVSPEDCRRLLEEQHTVVLDAVRFVALRHHLARDMADELRSRVMLRLAANDYAALRAWRRECSLHTYLVTVITRVFLDFRNQEWGRVKPPALVRRLGPRALTLWRFTHRRRLPFDEAAARCIEQDGGATRAELWTFYRQFPRVGGRHFVDTADLDQWEQPGSDADVLVVAGERRALAERVETALTDALVRLDRDERLILRLFFTEGLSRADIARTLRLDQSRLYPRFTAILGRLRGALAVRGVTVEDMRDVVGLPDADPLHTALDAASKTDAPGPSKYTDADTLPTPSADPGHRDP